MGTQLRIRRPPLQCQLEHRIAAQRIGVVAILIPGSDHQHAETNDLSQLMPDPLRHTRVSQTRRQPLRQAHPPLDLAQRQKPAFRGQPAAVETRHHGLVGDR